ncbi:hypothetical protein Cgig2_029599 [Carnegiea gigantea]|uniref:Uncharacterized protein n=1 Tax=Carnegiea gigantea TaxID=171969 RepID=A0A9Q1Q5Q4_9CARY|nr:hypothetical protein Cgig2_029599 [Carnegiea gigantea]
MVQDRTRPKIGADRTGTCSFGPVFGPLLFYFQSSVRSEFGLDGPPLGLCLSGLSVIANCSPLHPPAARGFQCGVSFGGGFLLPWNGFITTIDYFAYLNSDRSVDHVLAVVYMPIGLFSLLFSIFTARKSNAYVRINMGLGLLVVALLVMPIMDVANIKGQSGLYDEFYVTVAALGLLGLTDALVQGGLIRSAEELPERYCGIKFIWIPDKVKEMRRRNKDELYFYC